MMESAPRRVLYRCRTPTNLLCPCGAVERRLKKLGLEHRTERVRQRRAHRPEIVELTRQSHVPVLVDGGEVINDSRRILQYLDWAYGEGRDRKGPVDRATAGEADSRDRRMPLYNEKPDDGDPGSHPANR